jgi:hypothetical protein
MGDNRAHVDACSNPASHLVAIDVQPAPRTPLRTGLGPRRSQRAVSHANRRHVDHRAEMERETGAARVIPTGRVDEEHVGLAAERRHRGGQHRALAKGEQAGLVGRGRHGRDDHFGDEPVPNHHHGCDPGAIAGSSRSCFSRPVGDEATTHGRLAGPDRPRGRRQRPHQLLLGNE